MAELLGEPVCDVLLLVAVKSEEIALRETAAELGMELRDGASARLGPYMDLGMIGTDRVLAVRTRMGALGHGGAAYKALLFQTLTQATALIQVGMAFGVSPTRQRLGDVLVGEAIIPYDERDVREAGGQVYVDYRRMKRRLAKPSVVAMLRREARRTSYAVHCGALLSGNARIFSAAYRDQLLRDVPPGRHPIVGGEMEAIGLAITSPNASPSWGIVKGISDFADDERDAIIDVSRDPACRNAARFVLSALRNRQRE